MPRLATHQSPQPTTPSADLVTGAALVPTNQTKLNYLSTPSGHKSIEGRRRQPFRAARLPNKGACLGACGRSVACTTAPLRRALQAADQRRTRQLSCDTTSHDRVVGTNSQMREMARRCDQPETSTHTTRHSLKARPNPLGSGCGSQRPNDPPQYLIPAESALTPRNELNCTTKTVQPTAMC